ncbi:MAG: PD40 domain-containing protein [Betaproteobacteria bacterium]|nr:PD40 domain-containing protein [Betaproteobacteria bacterium]
MSGPPPASRLPARLRVGEFEVFPDSHELAGPAGVQRIRPLIMAVLLRLAAEPGQVVTRERLLADVWPRRMVNDEVLSRAIAELRTALGDDARQARYIETLPKAGYRLVAVVEPVGEAPATVEVPLAARKEAPAVPGRTHPAFVGIAVLAFLAVLAAGFAALRLDPEPGAELAGILAAAQPLTSDLSLELSPRFSPDGTRAAFVVADGDESRIAIQSLDGSPRRLIGEPGAVRQSPVFFPDGRRIAFWFAQGGDCALVEYDLDSGSKRDIVGCAAQPRPRFDLAPDGKRLAVTATHRAQFPAGIAIVDVASGEVRHLTKPEPGEGDDIHPRFSPDGKRIVFFRGTASHRRAWLVDADDPASAKPASALEGLTYGSAWLGPDGPLVVAADWLGFRALTLLDLGTGRARLLGARGARFPDVSPSGDVVFENAVYQANLWLADATDETAAPQPLWPSTRYTSQPEFSPDGTRLAFGSNREGLEAIYVGILGAPGDPAKLPLPTDHRFIRPHWSADGKHLYAVRIPVGALKAAVQHAVRVSVPEGRVEVLDHLGTSVNSVRPSPDGKWLYVGEIAGNAMRISRARAGTAEKPERLPLPVVGEFQLDAERLVFTQPNLAGATSCSLPELTCERIDVALDDGTRFDWLLAGRSLWFPVRAPGGRQLARYDLVEGRLAERRAFAPTANGLAIAASPDGKRLAIAREDAPAIDLMIARAARR